MILLIWHNYSQIKLFFDKKDVSLKGCVLFLTFISRNYIYYRAIKIKEYSNIFTINK